MLVPRLARLNAWHSRLSNRVTPMLNRFDQDLEQL